MGHILYLTVGRYILLLMQRLERLVNELEPELYPPEFIAEEVSSVN